jgi:hypothetical protein
MGRASVDERGFEAVRRIRESHGEVPLSAFKALVREQFNMLLLDPDAALSAIPSLLPADAETRLRAFRLVETALRARGETLVEDDKRMDEIARLFGLDEESRTGMVPTAQRRQERQQKAS